MKKYYQNIVFVMVLVAVLALNFVFCFRVDLTSDRRFSIAPQTKNLMRQTDASMSVNIYLTGDLNSGFFRLQQATDNLFSELAAYTSQNIHIRHVNPTDGKHAALSDVLIDRGLSPTYVYERSKDGNTSQKMVFPYAEITYKGRTVFVSLLKNIAGNSGDENLNISVENLEFEITDAVRRLMNTQVRKIAFIEGHGELSESETYDISKSLSSYFQIDRGVLQSDASILDNYEAVIVAGAKTPFSEGDKFILDRYLMRGGRVMWLLDGVELQQGDLTKSGVSAARPLDLNLGDLFFRYGVRFEPILVQDMQCVSVPVNIAPQGEVPQFEQVPFFYTPLLIPNPENSISKNLNEVRVQFPSAVSPPGNNTSLKITPLLFTSDNTHIVQTPTVVNLGEAIPTDKTYFNAAYVPVALLIEGVFDSNFQNRMAPQNMQNVRGIADRSVPTKQIFIASSNIIRNETSGVASDSTTLPLGFDRFSNQTFGNKDFIHNAVLYLTDSEQWLQLRSRTFKLRLLNKNLVENDALFWKIINMLLPITVLGIFGAIFFTVRKRRFI